MSAATGDTPQGSRGGPVCGSAGSRALFYIPMKASMMTTTAAVAPDERFALAAGAGGLLDDDGSVAVDPTLDASARRKNCGRVDARSLAGWTRSSGAIRS